MIFRGPPFLPKTLFHSLPITPREDQCSDQAFTALKAKEPSLTLNPQYDWMILEGFWWDFIYHFQPHNSPLPNYDISPTLSVPWNFRGFPFQKTGPLGAQVVVQKTDLRFKMTLLQEITQMTVIWHDLTWLRIHVHTFKTIQMYDA